MEEESKNLLPTVDVPDFVDEEEDEEYDVDYKPSPMWDLEKGDFVRTAANNVPMNDGYEAYKIWCVKTVSTERYSCLGYSDDHGTETEDITRESDQSTVELSLERTIQEMEKALLSQMNITQASFRKEQQSVQIRLSDRSLHRLNIWPEMVLMERLHLLAE